MDTTQKRHRLVYLRPLKLYLARISESDRLVRDQATSRLLLEILIWSFSHRLPTPVSPPNNPQETSASNSSVIQAQADFIRSVSLETVIEKATVDICMANQPEEEGGCFFSFACWD